MIEKIQPPNALIISSENKEKPKPKLVMIPVGGKEVIVTEAEFQNRFNVKGWVRIPSDEFGTIKMKDGKFGHLNLRRANHEEGRSIQS